MVSPIKLPPEKSLRRFTNKHLDERNSISMSWDEPVVKKEVGITQQEEQVK